VPNSASTRVLVALATYNEKENIGPLITGILRTVPEAAVLVIDDNSPDGTGKIADELAAADQRVHVLHRPGKLGLGTAILAAMRYAMDNDFLWLANMDADFSHHPRYLPALLAGMRDHDVMIGSRYVTGGVTVNWPFPRRLMSKSVNLLARFLMRIAAYDTSGAYRCFSVDLLRRAALERIVSRGYSFQEEVLYRCRLAGCRMGEIPIIFEDRRAGASKADLREAARSISVILWIGLRAFFGWDR
jgi:dolichol-phosphate mannosyltransferase